jgi:hypothetical protein
MKKKKSKKWPTPEELELETLKFNMSLSAKQKLKWLQEALEFYKKFTPKENQKAYLMLRDKGF